MVRHPYLRVEYRLAASRCRRWRVALEELGGVHDHHLSALHDQCV